ncbi:NAD-dependent epimerase/dehydratase family protein [Candidatus Uhrbacteria bacterium]|nr:NAD-dependent epimerase/dehydratase family protein [Candidatus Uhrbacteria bacterium]
MSYKKALVTGGAGFIASHLVDRLVEQGVAVTVVDDLSTGARKHVNSAARFEEVTILRPAFRGLVTEIKPDIIFHYAAAIDVREATRKPTNDAKVNILGTLAVIEAAKKAGTKQIVFASSGGAMFCDDVPPPYHEAIEPCPMSPYGISKRSAEMYLGFAAKEWGIKTAVMRYANVYGPRQGMGGEAGVISVFAKRLMAGEALTIRGDGKQTRDFLFVDDAVQAALEAGGGRRSGGAGSGSAGEAGGVYHIGTGIETTVLDLAMKMNRIHGSSMPPIFAAAGPGEVRRSVLVSEKAKKELGWEAKVGLEEGLKRTMEWFQKNNLSS